MLYALLALRINDDFIVLVTAVSVVRWPKKKLRNFLSPLIKRAANRTSFVVAAVRTVTVRRATAFNGRHSLKHPTCLCLCEFLRVLRDAF